MPTHLWLFGILHYMLYKCLRIYTHKSVKFTCSSRFSRASQSPQLVEKQPKSTPDMHNPPTLCRAGAGICIPTRTFIVAVRTSCECCEDSEKSQTTSINAFLCNCFFTLPASTLFGLTSWREGRGFTNLLTSRDLSPFYSMFALFPRCGEQLGRFTRCAFHRTSSHRI